MKFTLTRQAAQALTNLRRDADFAVFVNWLEECSEKVKEECFLAEDIALYRAQGKVFATRGIIEAYEKAPATLEKFKQVK